MTFCTPADTISELKSGHKVLIHSIAMAPLTLIEALAARASELRGVEMYQIHTEGPAPVPSRVWSRAFG